MTMATPEMMLMAVAVTRRHCRQYVLDSEYVCTREHVYVRCFVTYSEITITCDVASFRRARHLPGL